MTEYGQIELEDAGELAREVHIMCDERGIGQGTALSRLKRYRTVMECRLQEQGARIAALERRVAMLDRGLRYGEAIKEELPW